MSLRHERRRRVIAEDAHEAADGDGQSLRVTDARGGGAGAYALAAHRDQQPRLTDVFPRRNRWWALWMGLGLAAIVGLELLHGWRTSLEGIADPASLRALDLYDDCSLSGWLTSVLFGLCAWGAAVIYRVRRHRVDDYHGRYRIWLWVAAISSWMSMDAAAGLNRMVVALSASGLKRYNVPSGIFWTGLCALLGGYLALRLLIEIRRCTAALIAVLMASCAIGLGWAAAANWLPIDAQQTVMFAVGLGLLGQMCLILSGGLYARHVLLEVEGVIRSQPVKPKRPRPSRQAPAERSAAAEPAAARPQVKLHAGTQPAVAGQSKPYAEPAATKSPAAAATPRPSATANFDPEDLLEQSGGDRGMSRAERKRLRREKSQQRAA